MNPTLALDADAEDIAMLVNAAYRSFPGQAGWTHEGHLVAGPRIVAEQLRRLIRGGATILLLRDGARLLACVQVEPEDDAAYIGLFATDPVMQGQGLGKQLLAHAESHGCGSSDPGCCGCPCSRVGRNCSPSMNGADIGGPARRNPIRPLAKTVSRASQACS